MDLTQQHNTLKQLLAQFTKCELQLTAARAKELKAKNSLAEALSYLNAKDEVMSVLESLNESAHKKVLVSFERLLSAISSDVLEEQAHPVKLRLDIGKNQSSLDLYLDNQGNEESILEGNGGAMTNAICAGLRFGMLTRHKGLRRFITFDEADCWIKPERIDNFVRTISEASKQLRAQALMISHHYGSTYPSDMAVVLLEKDGAVVVQKGAEFESLTQPGFRYIKLTNFRRHASLLVPLSSGVTALIGDNNLGKSAVTGAWRAIGLGDSSDTDIKHNESTFEIEVGLENEVVVKVQRFRKKSPKMVWTVSAPDREAVQYTSENRGEAPEAIKKLLGLYPIDDLDVQLQGQKQPVFLLHETASKRAKLLSVGKESALIAKMMQLQNKQLVMHNDLKKKSETALEGIRRACDSSYPAWAELTLEDARSELDAAQSILDSTAKLNTELEKAEKLCTRLLELQKLEAISIPALPAALDSSGASVLLKAEPLLVSLESLKVIDTLRVPELPAVMDNSGLLSLIPGLEKFDQISKLEPVENLKLKVEDVSVLISTAQSFSSKESSSFDKLDTASSLLKKLIQLSPADKLNSESELLAKNTGKIVQLYELSKGADSSSKSMQNLTDLLSRLAVVQAQVKTEQDKLEDCQLEISLLVDEGGGICPMCNSVIGEHAHNH